ncbi:hypothetical protein M758_6G018900 [Ceratodon purpureus]|nr:hypothetical protein M758_6G018900 [Ceratodon purpureus]
MFRSFLRPPNESGRESSLSHKLIFNTSKLLSPPNDSGKLSIPEPERFKSSRFFKPPSEFGSRLRLQVHSRFNTSKLLAFPIDSLKVSMDSEPLKFKITKLLT